MKKITIKDLNIESKTVFLRVDYNVPLSDGGKIGDDTRIVLSLETINHALSKNCKIVLASHLGRPKGKKDPSMSLKPVAGYLSNLIKRDVKFIDDCIGDKVQDAIKALKQGELLLLENLRFYIEETKDNTDFAKKLAVLAEVYINDAFGAAHRAHASVHAIAQFMKTKGIGFLMEKEIFYLSKVLEGNEHPFIAILGGAKVSDKIEVIESLLQKVDKLLIGGAMAFTFLKAAGYDVGTSLVEEDKLEIAQSIMEKSGAAGCQLVLPVDVKAVNEVTPDAEVKVISIGKKFENRKGVDIGPESINLFSKALKDARLIFWNGPLGIFEMDKFAAGTLEIARAVSGSNAITIAGGGDTISAVKKAGVTEKFSHISTGGGAGLEFIAGQTLPGLSVIPDSQ